MDDVPVFNKEEAEGVLDLLKEHMLYQAGDVPEKQRRCIGKLLSEIQFSLESEATPKGLQVIK